jgi:DNA-binding PadR family transcriptional regulator
VEQPGAPAPTDRDVARRDPAEPVVGRPPPPNSATANAVLGLLSFGQELSGYDLKKWADHSLSFFFWSPAMSQIYGELRRLESLGYVTSRIEVKDDTRARRLYRITGSGREWLVTWLASEPADVPILKNPTVLRVWLGHLMEPASLRGVVEDHRHWLERRLAEVREDRARVPPDDVAMAYADVVIRWAERYYRAELENTDGLLVDLDELDVRRADD